MFASWLQESYLAEAGALEPNPDARPRMLGPKDMHVDNDGNFEIDMYDSDDDVAFFGGKGIKVMSFSRA